MTSLHDIASRYGLTDNEAAHILKLKPAIRRIGLDHYEVNAPMELYFERILAPYQKRDIRRTDLRK